MLLWGNENFFLKKQFNLKKSRIHYVSEQLKNMDFEKLKENPNEKNKSISNVNNLISNSTDKAKNPNSLLMKKGLNFGDILLRGVTQENNKKQKK